MWGCLLMIITVVGFQSHSVAADKRRHPAAHCGASGTPSSLVPCCATCRPSM